MSFVTSDSSAIWRSSIVCPPTTSAPLSRPPNRVARPPASIAALSIRSPIATVLTIVTILSRYERSGHRSRSRSQPSSEHCRPSADTAQFLRELAQHRGVARRDDRPRTALRGPQLSPAGGRCLRDDHDARRRIRRRMDCRIDAALSTRRDQGRAPLVAHPNAAAARAGARAEQLHRQPRHQSRARRPDEPRRARLHFLYRPGAIAAAAVRILRRGSHAAAHALRSRSTRRSRLVPRHGEADVPVERRGSERGRRPTPRGIMTALALVMALAVAAQPPAPDRILVMPFENAQRDGRIFWLGEGAAVLLTDDLSGLAANAISREERQQAFERLQVPPRAVLTDATIIRIGQIVGAE